MKRRRLAVLGCLVACLVLIVGNACVQDTPAIFIVQNSALDGSCNASRSQSGEIQSAGQMDLSVARAYQMNLVVENLMSPSGSVSLGGGGATGRYEGNRVTFTNAIVSLEGPPSGLAVPLPKNQAIPISGTLEPGGNTLVTLDVISSTLGEQLASAISRRGTVVPLTVTVRFEGVTTSGSEVDSNAFRFPLELCRGCLLSFPLEAIDDRFPAPNCLNTDDDQTVSTACLPGQDEALDCRSCREILKARGETDEFINTICEPSAATL